jgi:hypothetical protein
MIVLSRATACVRSAPTSSADDDVVAFVQALRDVLAEPASRLDEVCGRRRVVRPSFARALTAVFDDAQAGDRAACRAH